jgi:hypothetical protein
MTALLALRAFRSPDSSHTSPGRFPEKDANTIGGRKSKTKRFLRLVLVLGNAEAELESPSDEELVQQLEQFAVVVEDVVGLPPSLGVAIVVHPPVADGPHT